MTADTDAWFDGLTYWIACPEHGEHVAEVVAPGLARCLGSDGAVSFVEPMRCERVAEVHPRGSVRPGSGGSGRGGRTDRAGDDVECNGGSEEREQAGNVDGD